MKLCYTEFYGKIVAKEIVKSKPLKRKAKVTKKPVKRKDKPVLPERGIVLGDL